MSATMRRTYVEVIQARLDRGSITHAEAKALRERHAKGMQVNGEHKSRRDAMVKAGRREG